MRVYTVDLNPRRKYTVVDAPKKVRTRWAKKAWATRRSASLRDCQSKLGKCSPCAPGVTEIGQPSLGRLTGQFAERLGFNPMNSMDDMDRIAASNPELLIVHNPAGKGKKAMRRKRKKSGGGRLSIKVGGRRLTWKGCVKKYKSIKKAAAVWKKKPKYMGRKRLGKCRSAKACRKASRRIRKGGRSRRKSRKGRRSRRSKR